jgi:hypothetical protein
MSTDPSAAGPQRTRVKSWSEMSTLEKTAVILVFAVPVLCCGGVLGMIDDDPETETVAGEPTEGEASESEFALPSDRTTFYGSTEAPASASPEPEPEPETEEETEAAEVYYDNCDAARDAGAAPVREDDPGYGDHLDRDGDGVGCEDSDSGGDGGGDSGGGGGDSGDDGGGSVHYENCDAARAAGAAPLYEGEPGYRSGLDRDGDGDACE